MLIKLGNVIVKCDPPPKASLQNVTLPKSSILKDDPPPIPPAHPVIINESSLTVTHFLFSRRQRIHFANASKFSFSLFFMISMKDSCNLCCLTSIFIISCLSTSTKGVWVENASHLLFRWSYNIYIYALQVPLPVYMLNWWALRRNCVREALMYGFILLHICTIHSLVPLWINDMTLMYLHIIMSVIIK